jgi:NADH dehydrogenase
MKPTAIARNEPTILVLGGAGFIGRHAVAALLQRRCRIVVGSRHPLRIDARLPAGAVRCPRRTARLETLQEPADWLPLLEGVDVVVNCVGILRQRWGETYERVHHRAPAALALACTQRHVRLVHVSAIALGEATGSRFQRSKLAGERAIRAAGGDWHLVRPSLLDGDGGFGARWLRTLARLPVHALPADATGRIAALHVADLGEALARLALAPPAAPGAAREHELGGNEAFALADYLVRLRDPRLPPARRIAVPAWLARLASHACDVLHFSPFSYAHWEMLQRDNVPNPNRAAAILGREPRPVGAAARRPAAADVAPGDARQAPALR